MVHCEDLVNGVSLLVLSSAVKLKGMRPEFGKCATGRTFSMAWACKPQLKAWHQCIRDQ